MMHRLVISADLQALKDIITAKRSDESGAGRTPELCFSCQTQVTTRVSLLTWKHLSESHVLSHE